MQQRTILSKGKKYIVNCPSSEDVGPACNPGTLWMQSSNLLWYSVNLTGTSASNDIALYVNQTPLNWVSPGGQDFGYQLLACIDNTASYQVYLSGSTGDVTCSIAQTPWAYDQSNTKPYLLLQSLTDGYCYPVYARSGSIYLFPSPNGRVWMQNTNPPPVPSVSPVIPFSYAPDTAIVGWYDKNWTPEQGEPKTGNLAYFNANADKASVISINVENRGLIELTIGSEFPMLQELTCYGNNFSTIDISNLTELVNFSGENLSSLDTSKNVNLVEVSVSNSPLLSVDISKNTKLNVIQFISCGLTSIDLSHNTKVSILVLSENSLTSVDISNNPLINTCIFNNNALTNVDDILSNLNIAGINGGILRLQGGTNTVPTGGINNTDYIALNGRGWSMQINT